MARGTVLVVDDTEATRHMYARILEHAGYETLAASSGREALDLLERYSPSLVVLDYTMPGMDGPSVVRAIRTMDHGASVPVMLLTASGMPEHIDASFDAGADDYMVKPADRRILLARIASLITLQRTTALERERDELHRALEDARRVQRDELPPEPVAAFGWRAWGAVVPCGQVGGDVFELHYAPPSDEEPDGALVGCLIDVSGHGLAAALVATSVRAAFRLLSARGSLESTMHALNDLLCERGTSRPTLHYACIAAVRITPQKITAINAGLPPIAILSDGRIVQTITASGVPPGLLEGSRYVETEIARDGISRIALVSDGLTEPFGMADDVAGCIARIALQEAAASPIDGLTERVALAVATTPENTRDDATLLLFEKDFSSDMDTKGISRTFRARRESIAEATVWIATRLEDLKERERVRVGFTEAASNALIHGALGIDSRTRATDIRLYLSAIERAEIDHAFDPNPIAVAMKTEGSRTTITLSWEGTPCPLENRRRPQHDVHPLADSGRGLHLIYASFDEVHWAEGGRSMELVLERDTW